MPCASRLGQSEQIGMDSISGHVRLLESGHHPVLAAALGDSPETVQSIHMLGRGLCRAYVAGHPARFEGAIVQPIAWPEEPAGFGPDPKLLWALLQLVEGWTCILVDTAVAPALGRIIEVELGHRVRYLDDVTHLLTRPVRLERNEAVRRLTLADLVRLESAPLELRSSLWRDTRQLLAEGLVASAVVSERIVATALVAACSDHYADIGVYTREGYRGRGYATAAASLVAQGVQEGGRFPLWGAGAHNQASLRVAQKLGFQEVSRRRYVILE
jgi:RimJ/RimL family protein N-acetyltransferase